MKKGVGVWYFKEKECNLLEDVKDKSIHKPWDIKGFDQIGLARFLPIHHI